MKWKIIIKDPKSQPKAGTYSDWKPQIAAECNHQCIYCCISEGHWGGMDNFHVEHFRPKSLFKSLENKIINLFYACPVCNRFKGDDWQSEPDLHQISYIDPSLVDYTTIFELDQVSNKLIGLYVASRYMIERLYLNRPQLIHERREYKLIREEKAIINRINELLKQTNDLDLTKKCIEKIVEIHDHLHKRSELLPYKLNEIRKQKA